LARQDEALAIRYICFVAGPHSQKASRPSGLLSHGGPFTHSAAGNYAPSHALT